MAPRLMVMLVKPSMLERVREDIRRVDDLFNTGEGQGQGVEGKGFKVGEDEDLHDVHVFI